MISSSVFYAQDTVSYYVEFQDGQSIDLLSTITNSDNTVAITTNKTSFNTFVTGAPIYKFEKAFPLFTTPRLQRVYLMEVPVSYNITAYSERSDIVQLLPYVDDEPILLMNDEPNDYIENLQENRPNPSLDLVKAPLAWSITTGDPNIYIGVIDGDFLVTHEDIQTKIIDNLDDSPPSTIPETAYSYLRHGTATSSIAAASTNNGIGMASIGYNTNIITADGFGNVNRVKQISLIPGVRVINCSWHTFCTYSELHAISYQEILDSGVVFVAGAGNAGIFFGSCNNDPNKPRYPASYDALISVTSVGKREHIGDFHGLVNEVGDRLWDDSWIDCHLRRPQFHPDVSHTHNDKVNVTAPGYLFQMASVAPDLTTSTYVYGGGTSGATPFVSGLAALVFAANPNLTGQEAKDIIESTADDIYYIPYNRNVDPALDLLGKLGTGRINAFRAVKTAKCSEVSSPNHDFAMQNSRYDIFEEPDIKTAEVFWQSEDIWVRNTNDGQLIQKHQNPEYDETDPNYAYVEVTNNSCWVTNQDTRTTVTLYWAKANTSLAWPDNWDGSTTMTDPITGLTVEMGGIVGTVEIPSLKIGQSKTIEFPWHIPNPDDYININPNPWHFCLLARIDSHLDTMTFTETASITDNVINNNNLSWKNTTIVDLETLSGSSTGGVIGIGNPTNTAKSYTLEFRSKANETGKAIYEEAEVSITMDMALWTAWEAGGGMSESFIPQKQLQRKLVDSANAQLENIQLGPGEITTAYISFNFLTKELTDKELYFYEVLQRDAITNEIIGGETFEIRKKHRVVFDADAGIDQQVEKNESVTLQAADINENATYNWYDLEGNLIYTGSQFSLTPEITKKYKLEIISEIDGLKDYDEVEIKVNPYKIVSMSPNPANNQVIINYDAELADSAYLRIVNTNTGIEHNYILDVLENTITVDVSLFNIGSYVVALICNGEFQTSKILVKQ